MSFEEWWKTKDYPARCKGNCKEAYEAGMKADVHTDNSQVIAELEQENAKLRKELKEWKDEWQEQVQKATDEGYARTLQTMQLTKSKEIIKNLLSAYTTYADSFDDRDNEIVDEAEQFLREIKEND